MGEAIVASARDAAFVAAVNGTAGTTANALGAIGSTGISAAALASMAAPGFPAARADPTGTHPNDDYSAALLRQALLAAQVQAQQRQRMAALASATAGVGGDVNALINALLGPRDVNQAVDAWKLVSATSNVGASDAGGGTDASAANPAAAAAALFPGQMPNATTTNPLANLAALRALGGGFGVPGAATVANAPRGVPGGAPAMAGGFADDSAARAAILFGAASGIPAGGAYGVNPSPFGVAGAGAPRTSGADASVAAAAALAAKGGGGGDDEAVAAAAAAFFAAMNANTQNAAARNANAQNAVENAGTRGRDSGVSEDTDVGKEGDARRHKEGSVRSPRRDDAAEDDAPKEQAPPVEAPPVEALPSNVAAAVAGGGD